VAVEAAVEEAAAAEVAVEAVSISIRSESRGSDEARSRSGRRPPVHADG
jgi:hypothetical protein